MNDACCALTDDAYSAVEPTRKLRSRDMIRPSAEEWEGRETEQYVDSEPGTT